MTPFIYPTEIHFKIIDSIIDGGLNEDIGTGDHTTLATIGEHATGRARCLIKEDGILAGMSIAQRIFERTNPQMTFHAQSEDGSDVKAGMIAFEVSGSVRTILSCERLVLNIMQRMSGIATQTRKMVNLLEGTKCRLLDTRKTTPLVRYLEKWAVLIGGGQNHRYGLFDMILIKDNHIDHAGGITPAIQLVKKYLQENNLNLPIVVETRTLQEVEEACLAGGITRILLDNMDEEMMREAIALIAGRFPTEASGNITLENLRSKALTGVDFISTGALTHSFKSLDISLKIVK